MYFRMLLIMTVNLYTFKKIYITIGIEGYGLYDLIGGVIMLFSFLNEAMTRSTQRFLTFELGKQNIEKVKKIFSTSLVIHITAAFFIFIVAETIGHFFLCKLNIPPEKLSIAKIIFHFTTISFCLQIIRVPFNSTIVSYEKMSFFVHVGILEVILQLLIAFFLPVIIFDKTITYSALLCTVNFIVLATYIVYCIKSFNAINFKFHKEWSLYKTLLSFSGWSLLGCSANVCTQQGSKILLNTFTNVSTNAAMGIANKISFGLYSLVSSFQKAFEPQLVKLYAQKDKKLVSFIFKTSKLSYFLLLLIVLPFVFNIDFLLKLWLVEIPKYSTSFTVLTMIFLLIDSISAPLWMMVSATGKIQTYQIVISFLIFLNLPISLIILMMGFPPYYILWVRVLSNVLTYIYRISYVNKLFFDFSKQYLVKVLLRCILTTITVLPVLFIIKTFTSSYISVVLSIFTSLVIIPIASYIIGLTRNERETINVIILRKLKYAFSR